MVRANFSKEIARIAVISELPDLQGTIHNYALCTMHYELKKLPISSQKSPFSTLENALSLLSETQTLHVGKALATRGKCSRHTWHPLSPHLGGPNPTYFDAISLIFESDILQEECENAFLFVSGCLGQVQPLLRQECKRAYRDMD